MLFDEDCRGCTISFLSLVVQISLFLVVCSIRTTILLFANREGGLLASERFSGINIS